MVLIYWEMDIYDILGFVLINTHIYIYKEVGQMDGS